MAERTSWQAASGRPRRPAGRGEAGRGEAGMRVFLGAQQRCSPAQRRVIAALRVALRDAGCRPVAMGTDPQAATRDPLPRICRTIRACDAAIIVAFERVRMASAVEYPATQHAIDVGGRSVSAVWNHIEAAMAYQAGLPLLILQERGLFQYGMVNVRRTTIRFGEFCTRDDAADAVVAVRACVGEWCRTLRRPRGAATARRYAGDGRASGGTGGTQDG